ncbi:MAG: phage terminase large subunit [Gammaproteobacteria bacterium]
MPLDGHSPGHKITVRLPKPHAAQRQILAERRRFNVGVCGRRFGKSTLGVHILLLPGGALDGRPVAWFAPTYKLLDDVWRTARRLLAPIITRQNVQQMRMELITGGSIDYWTLDNPDAGRGRKYARVVIDEAAMARYLEDSWQQAIRPTLTDLEGDAWFFSTPKGTGNYFAQLFREAPAREGWAYWQMPSTANPHLPPAELEAARLELPELVFRQEYLAEFVDFAGTAVRREWLQYADPPAALTIAMGVDLAISTKSDADWTACATLGRAADGRVWVLDVQRLRASFHQVLGFIQAQAAKWKPAVIAIEEVQYQAAVVQELLRTTRLPVRGVKPERDKLTRFLPLTARYEQRLVYHALGLAGAFEEELLSFPVGEHDDQIDAAGFAFAALPLTGGYAAHPVPLRGAGRAAIL